MRSVLRIRLLLASSVAITLACGGSAGTADSATASAVDARGVRDSGIAGTPAAPADSDTGHVDGDVRVHAVVADLDCDTREDSAVLLRSDSVVTLLVHRASRNAADSIQFWTHYNGREGIYGSRVFLLRTALDYTPGEQEIPDLPGFRPSTSCFGLQLGDGMTDSRWFYWNWDAQRLDFWRR